ncbi:hypothetical protein [Colwellia ponticola]|uniref:hypothetical protein n=1 Tax=Colwellia ponticola TaxID=2304625 RepID=UPI002482AA6D|nr:hypothetical protein [Colwellia ponticola]
MDDDAWNATPVFTTNYQVFPRTLSKHHNNFSYRVITTEKGIFLGLKATTENILRIRTQENDKVFSNDHFQIMLDVNNDEQESYIFVINHQGNYFDGNYNIGREIDLDWSAQWEYQVKIDNDNWIAEVFIPWDTMTFSVEAKNELGVYISRFDESSNATYASAPVNKEMNGFFQKFSTIFNHRC